jgi:hypothetical protein
MAKPQSRQKDKAASAGRSPAYPFIPLGRAIARADQLWRAVGDAEVDVGQARRHWGYGPSSSGGIQTEAALKQFGLLEVSGRGKGRRLKLSAMARRLAEPTLEPHERRKLFERAALAPSIHRELHDRWGAALPASETKSFLVDERGFNAKGAGDLIAEYKKTIAHLELLEGAPTAERRLDAAGQPAASRITPPNLAPATEDNQIRVLVDGQHLSVTARVDRQGLKKLIKLLQANGALLGDDKK